MARAQIKTTIYTDFKGVDFSTDPSQASKSRSPLATNMIADTGGCPEKRPGWRTLLTFPAEGEEKDNDEEKMPPRVHGIWSGEIEGKTHFLAHVGTKLYRWNEEDGSSTELADGLSDKSGAGVYFGGKLYIAAGKYLVYDGGETREVGEDGYVPMTSIARESTGGGSSYESVNLISPWRKNGFQTDGTARSFQLDTDMLDLSMTATQAFPGSAGGYAALYYDNSIYAWFQPGKIYEAGTKLSFDWEEKKVTIGQDSVELHIESRSASGTVNLASCASVDEGCRVTAEVWGEETDVARVNYYTGEVYMSTAPAAPFAGSADGLTVKFAKTVKDYAARIAGCSVIAAYGVGSNDRLVFSGNPDFPNQDWISAMNDPSYIPDLSYSTVGLENVAIMGYVRIGDRLAVIKQDCGQDSTVFLRSAHLDTDGEVLFPLEQAVAGVGAVSRRSFAQLLDEPLFLSSTGIFALTSNVITNERMCQNRSFYINSRLIAEPGLADACAVAYKGMYMLAVNSHVYILDARQQKTYRSESLGDYVYESYYWEDVPAVCWHNYKHESEESLYFGTADGRICRFNTDIEGIQKYNDDGRAIAAVWATKADDDGDPTRLKTMIKKGCAVTLKPYKRSSAKICFRTDRDAVDYQVRYDIADIFDWEDIDFSRFTFNANDAPQEIMFQSKVKKYKRLQIIIRSDGLDEGFGVYGITKHFVTGNFAKR